MAVKEFGVGKWTKMSKSVSGRILRENGRSNVDLKDKWRNLYKAYNINVEDEVALKSLLDVVAARMSAKKRLVHADIERKHDEQKHKNTKIQNDEACQVDDDAGSTLVIEQHMEACVTEAEDAHPNTASRQNYVKLVKDKESALFKEAIVKVEENDIEAANGLIFDSLDLRSKAFGDRAIHVALEDCGRTLEAYKRKAVNVLATFHKADLTVFVETVRKVEDCMLEAREQLRKADLFDRQSIEEDMRPTSLMEQGTFNIFDFDDIQKI